jgi:hypothetical protein
MSSTFRRAVAILSLATFVAIAPAQAKPFGRWSLEGAARIESAARGFFAFLLRLFELPQAEEKQQSTMDPNGKPPSGPGGNP